MVWAVLGWLTMAAIAVTTLGSLGVLWVAAEHPPALDPWLRRRVRVPREVPRVEWAVPDQDNPIPGV